MKKQVHFRFLVSIRNLDSELKENENDEYTSMLRSCRRRLVLNPWPVFTLRDQTSLADSLLLMDWNDNVRELQTEYKCNFLQVTGIPVSVVKPVITPQLGARLATCCVVTVTDEDGANPRSRWVPFIIDTGAPRAVYLSNNVWAMLGVRAVPRARRELAAFARNIQIGKWIGPALLSEEHGESATHLQDVNVIGMELLGSRDVATNFTGILQRALEKPFSEVIVTDGSSTFRVTPSHPDVMSLKDAIKAKRPNELQHIDADRIVVKLQRDGPALGDRDTLRVDSEYYFEAPAAPERK